MVQTAHKRPASAMLNLDRAALVARLRLALSPREGEATSDFDLNPSMPRPTANLRPAGVLLAITPDQQLILTKRSSHLKHHPGQIALPGGKVDPGDVDAIGAALREAEEEVGLPKGVAEVIGILPSHITVTNFSMTPVLALVPDFTAIAEAGEVDEVFRVPLAHLLDPTNYSIQSRVYKGADRSYFAVPYGPYYIWGATARILRVLAGRMQ